METRSRILIIDDEEVVLDSCLAVLKRANHEIAVTRDGTAGLALAKEFGPDLILVDLMMPGITGFEVLEALRAADPAVVAIVITGYSTVGSAVEAMKRGAFDFLPKPFTPDELRLIVDRGLEKRRLVLETLALRKEREMVRENFAAIVSHELRSPLSAVQQNLYGLAAELEAKLDDAQKNRLERMKVRIADMLKLIETWLRAVSVPNDDIRERFAPVSLGPCIAKAVETALPHATRKDVTITETVAGALPCVKGDEGSLTEAIVNLVNNAVKYSKTGGKVEVRAAAADGRVTVSVADNGVGIAPEDLPFVFDGFFRGKTAAAETGVGLGLALARRIVESHDGAISVESQLGKGTTFVISLPVPAPDNPSPAAP